MHFGVFVALLSLYLDIKTGEALINGQFLLLVNKAVLPTPSTPFRWMLLLLVVELYPLQSGSKVGAQDQTVAFLFLFQLSSYSLLS
jgi:hypothetical protein